MILIYGKGKVGQGLQKLCTYLDVPYTICDDSDAPQDFSDFDAIIPSPGIPGTHPIYQEPAVICELDFVTDIIPEGFKRICITGTDGKSTTCHMLYEILRQSLPESQVYLTGNNDESLSTTLVGILERGELEGYLVIEVSSFMVQILKQFTSEITIITNLHPDHLDWHRDLEEYYGAKMQLAYMTTEELIVSDALFEQVESFDTLAPDITTINTKNAETNYVDPPKIHFDEKVIDISNMQFSGRYNSNNLLMALLAAKKCGIETPEKEEILKNITPLAHRIEEILTTKDNVRWIEDSKSTTSQSQMAALDAMEDGKTILIAGGKDKGDPFEGIDSAWKQKCKHIFLIGEVASFLQGKANENDIENTVCGSLEDAVHSAKKTATSGDSVLFSPGCSSFDMFENYLDRANKYRDLVKKIGND